MALCDLLVGRRTTTLIGPAEAHIVSPGPLPRPLGLIDQQEAYFATADYFAACRSRRPLRQAASDMYSNPACAFRSPLRCDVKRGPNGGLLVFRGALRAVTFGQFNIRRRRQVGLAGGVRAVRESQSSFVFCRCRVDQPDQPSRKSMSSLLTISGCSSWGRCPHSGISAVFRFSAISPHTAGISNIWPTA
jgi:hypothetical protein